MNAMCDVGNRLNRIEALVSRNAPEPCQEEHWKLVERCTVGDVNDNVPPF